MKWSVAEGREISEDVVGMGTRNGIGTSIYTCYTFWKPAICRCLTPLKAR